MTSDGGLVYRCGPTIAWTKDASQTILVDEENQRFWSLQGVEAVIWDLLTLNYTFEKISAFLAVLLDHSSEEARRTLLVTIQGWEKEGIVGIAGGTGSGQPGD